MVETRVRFRGNFRELFSASAGPGIGARRRLPHMTEKRSSSRARTTRSPSPPPTRTVTVRLGGRTIAKTERALVLQEASYPPVHYLPLDDVEADALAAVVARDVLSVQGRRLLLLARRRRHGHRGRRVDLRRAVRRGLRDREPRRVLPPARGDLRGLTSGAHASPRGTVTAMPGAVDAVVATMQSRLDATDRCAGAAARVPRHLPAHDARGREGRRRRAVRGPRVGRAVGRRVRRALPDRPRRAPVGRYALAAVAARLRRARRPTGPAAGPARHQRPRELRPPAGAARGHHRRRLRRPVA